MVCRESRIRHQFRIYGNYFVRAANGTMLEIIPSVGERGSNQMKDPGIRHLAIEVDDFDERPNSAS